MLWELLVSIFGHQHSDYILREDAQQVITQDDIDKLVENVHKLVMLPGEEIIHVFAQE